MDDFRHAKLQSLSKVIVALATASLMSACGSAFRTSVSSTQGAKVADVDQTTTISEKKPRSKQQAAPETQKPTEQKPQQPDSQTPAQPEVKTEESKPEAPPATVETAPQPVPTPAPVPRDHSQAPAEPKPAPAPKDHTQTPAQPEVAPETPKAETSVDPKSAPPKAQEPEPFVPKTQKKSLSWDDFHSATLWMRTPNSRQWTQTAMTEIHTNIATFDRTRDISAFCPGYMVTTQAYRELCWLRLVSAVAKFESQHNPLATFREPNGNVSIGLFALSPNECDNAPKVADLKDAQRNISCGIGKMADLIQRDGYLDGPEGHRGAASYWSVLRPPYSAYGYTNLGKKNEIMKFTRVYQSF